MANPIIQPGTRFGRMTVVGVMPKDYPRYRNRMYAAQCDCGAEKIVRGVHLTTGAVVSCGCYSMDQKREIHKDLTGATQGQLFVLGQAPRVNQKVMWRCQCSCGNIATVSGTSWSDGTQSCGCLLGQKNRSRSVDVTGHRFGRLVALERASGRAYTAWRCQCDCGEVSIVKTSDLRSGNTKSCGCGSSRLMKRTHGLSRTPEMKRFYAMKRLCAKRQQTPKWADMEAIKQIYLNCPPGYQVDHIIPLQGRRVAGLHIESNLQYLTRQENWDKKHKFEPQFISANNT